MPAGQMAQYIEKMSDEAAANYAFMQLKKILPEASNPVMITDFSIYLLQTYQFFFVFLCSRPSV